MSNLKANFKVNTLKSAMTANRLKQQS